MKIFEFYDDICKYIKNNKSLVLTGAAVVGVATEAIVSVRAGEKLAKRKTEVADIKAKNPDMTKKEKVKLGVKKYAPTMAPVVVVGGLTAFAAIKSYNVSAKEIAGLTTAYAVTKEALDQHKIKTEKLLGEKAAKQVRNAINQDDADKNACPEKLQDEQKKEREEYENNKNNGTVATECCLQELFYDKLSKQWFRTNLDNVYRAAAKCQKIINAGMNDFVPANDFYYELHIDGLDYDTEVGKIFGWSQYIKGGEMKMTCDSFIKAPNGEKATVIELECCNLYEAQNAASCGGDGEWRRW